MECLGYLFRFVLVIVLISLTLKCACKIDKTLPSKANFLEYHQLDFHPITNYNLQNYNYFFLKSDFFPNSPSNFPQLRDYPTA